MDSESFLAAAMQTLALSSSNAGVNPTFNLPTNTNPDSHINDGSKSTLDPDILFPPNIYPQLNSLKREIRHSKVPDNDMEPLHWPTGKRSNRPFENVNSDWLSILHSLSPRSFPVPPIPTPRPSVQPKQYPTAYYLEQAAFYTQLPGPDPFYSEPAPVRPGPLRVFVYAFFSLLPWPLAPLFSGAQCFVLGVWAVLRLLPLVLVLPVKFVAGRVVMAKWRWDFVLGVMLATQLVRMLPSVGFPDGAEEEGQRGPLYTIFVPGPEAIGNSAVFQSKGF